MFVFLGDRQLVKTRREVDLSECRLPLRLENMPLSTTSGELSRRQSTYRLMVPSFFLTQRTCLAHGDFEGRMIPRSFQLVNFFPNHRDFLRRESTLFLSHGRAGFIYKGEWALTVDTRRHAFGHSWE